LSWGREYFLENARGTNEIKWLHKR
jgi:hypothetical protein